MDKAQIIGILKDISVFLELKGDNSFKIRAYQTGARALERLEDNFDTIVKEGKISSLQGVGQALALKIETLYYESHLPFYDNLKASIAPGLIEFLDIPGLGGKKVKYIHDALGIETIEALKEACKSGTIEALDGFGAKSAEKILSGITNREAYGQRHLWWSVQEFVQEIVSGLEAHALVKRASVAGSFRRRLETVGDLDFIAASDTPEPIMDWFTEMEGVKEITAKGETKSSVRFENGIQADLRVVTDKEFVFSLHHFTGSKDHNVMMRQRALSKGYRLSEWGIFDKDSGENISTEEVNFIQTETDLFKFFDLEMIEPELREGLGEIIAAENKKLPQLIESNEIKGVFHNHTILSDGMNTLDEMVEQAESLGWSYLGFADHSKSSVQANGLNEERVHKMIEQIQSFNESGSSSVTAFSGIECDILKDGTLDLDESVLSKLDYVVASVHSSFSQSEEEMTDRVIRAIESPSITMLGHPTGRLLLRREGYKINISKVIDAALANKVIIEINANPQRLDMDWRFWKQAAQRGLMCSINPDAHSIKNLGYYEAGVNIARKGWIEANSLLNTRDTDGIKRWFTERS